jgi:cob(I)alamin adenosyltransferase
VAKSDSRLAAYADADEANAAIGAAIVFGGLDERITAVLARVQNELFDLGADLANPISEEPPAYPPLRIDEAYVTRLEAECDEFNEDLPVLRSFILPGGTPGATLLHVARTVTRRAERSAWAAVADHGESVSEMPAKYLNRLSDLLFILCRVANAGVGDVLWKPGGDR